MCRPSWWVTRDMCGLITANMTIGLLVFAEVVVTGLLLPSWMGVNANTIIYTILTALAMWSHSKAQYTNPGTVPLDVPPSGSAVSVAPAPLSGIGIGVADGGHRDSGSSTGSNGNEPLIGVRIDANDNTAPPHAGAAANASAGPHVVHAPVSFIPGGAVAAAGGVASIAPIGGTHSSVAAQQRLCRSCHVAKPYRAHHCSLCGRCVVKMDHHCPWVNNCVAYCNQKYFLQFLFYTFICCLYSGVLCVTRFALCTRSPSTCSYDGAEVGLSIGLFIEALIFGCFTITMLCDQIWAIFENTPGIDALQRRRTGPRKPRYESLQDVMGDPFGWRWFVPLPHSQKLLSAFNSELSHFDEPVEAKAR